MDELIASIIRHKFLVMQLGLVAVLMIVLMLQTKKVWQENVIGISAAVLSIVFVFRSNL